MLLISEALKVCFCVSFVASMALFSAGLHDAADDDEGQRSCEVSGLLHSGPGHDVSPQSQLEAVYDHLLWSAL